MRIALALGAGGIVGAAWMVGALDALEQRGGLRPADADELVGTSVGSLIATMVAAEVPTAAMAAYATGEQSAALAGLDGHDATSLRLTRLPLPLGPGSLRMALAARSRGKVLSGLLPRGVVSTAPVRALVEHVVGENWPSACPLRITACDYGSGERVELGTGRTPVCTPGEAVAASCAIPGFYEPVAIGSRLYIDGGVHSHSNLDLLAGRGLDAVIVLNPMSSGAWVAGSGGVRERLAALRRRRSAAQLAGEVAALRAEGTRVLVLEPAFADIAAMGSNMMARDRRGEVLEAGRASTERALARLGRKRLRSVGLSPG
ncbi:MAG TPA: patatin-like phospholipase family protein [Solirubrobacteraceae bacterium]|nr:patatin-like phospholipase family protein [Solirubrobacteraceae bacterium]